MGCALPTRKKTYSGGCFSSGKSPSLQDPIVRMKHRAPLKAVVSKGGTGGGLLPIKGHLQYLDSWSGNRDAGTVQDNWNRLAPVSVRTEVDRPCLRQLSNV